MALSIAGTVAILLSAVFYGSYFVPAKKYEIHDGLIFQWYQCSGIMISGFICAIFRNNWHETGEQSSGFYVAPEGMLSGLIFVVGNITGTFSVKACGLGNYYTVHQVTNLGITFLVGVYGPSLGVPSTPPHDVGLAALGFLCVLIGMMPIMFMEKDSNGASSAPTKPLTSFPEDAEAEPISPGGAGRPPTKLDLLFQEHQGDAQSEQSPVGSSPSPSRVPISPRPSKVLEHRQVPGVDPGSSGTLGLQKPLLGFEKPMLSFKKPMLEPVKTSFRQLNAFTWDGTLGRPVFSKEPNSPPLSCLGDISMVVKEIDDEGEFDDSPNFEGDPVDGQPLLGKRADDGFRTWLGGIALSLLTGAVMAVIYLPQLVWKARLKETGVTPQGFDYFFSMSVGIYLGSTAWLICGGAWRRYRQQRIEKSVLRPALVSGILYGCAVQSFLYAMMVLPYAIGYALGCGGGLVVSLLWSTLAFGEAASSHNRLCVVCSLAGVLLGMFLTGLSA